MKQIINELSKEVTELKDRGEIGLFAELKLHYIINKLKEAINYTHCCKSDSEQLLFSTDEIVSKINEQTVLDGETFRVYFREK
jgi:hypothetical protein